MPAFVCYRCGRGTLVRSNMKLLPDGTPYCRSDEGCAKYATEHYPPCAGNVTGCRRPESECVCMFTQFGKSQIKEHSND